MGAALDSMRLNKPWCALVAALSNNSFSSYLELNNQHCPPNSVWRIFPNDNALKLFTSVIDNRLEELLGVRPVQIPGTSRSFGPLNGNLYLIADVHMLQFLKSNQLAIPVRIK